MDISQKPYFQYNEIIDSLLSPIHSLADVKLDCLIRKYANGERFLISTNKEESTSFIENKLYRYGLYERNYKDVSSCFQMWDHFLYTPPEIYQRKSQKFNMAHGLTIVQQQGDFCDFFNFSTSTGNNQINNFYLNQKDLFTQFIQDFYMDLSSTLEDLSHHTFRLPKGTTFVEYALLTLSSRQQDCAKLLVQGYKTKEIARLLDLSPRTVEMHISILMDKFKVRNRAQLTYAISKLL